jgi:hypothetical protein
MATEVFINIKELPEITEISNGDYILLETANGTKIVDFQNFILPEKNTLVSTKVNLVENQLSSFSSSFNTKYDTLISDNASITTNFQTLCSRVLKTSLEYYGKAEITITANNNQGTAVISPLPSSSVLPNIQTSDLIIYPLNEYASKFPAYVMDFNKTTGLITIKGSFYKTKFTFSASQAIPITTTTTGVLCTVNAVSYASSLTISNDSLQNILNNATVTTEFIAAEENAVYGIAVIKTSTV